MKRKLYFSPSLMCGNLLNLQRDIDLLEKYGMDFLHLDVMDLNFVPNLTLGFDLINQIQSTIPKEIHLMVKNVDWALARLQTQAKNFITFHLEAVGDIKREIKEIKKRAKVGLAINPLTPVEAVFPYLEHLDLVLLMSVQPGFAGQKFKEETYQKAKELREKLGQRKILVGVDGGIGFEQILKFKDLGVNFFVLGTSSLYKGNLEENLKRFAVFRKTLG